eukprot:TRINITY_DN274_c0_g1_i2.p1 TRINITY_DN274_c0_g1~~TRINITY_DN274_c0_g1_i2.p1  ORF type:complete len:571 (+),score=60.37 TRINITY_DN274_c0_g1_i2:290-2002(+)
MGSTGAGKSTLLDILYGRAKTGRVSGQVLANGTPRNRFFKRLSSYVTQDDCLMGTQTIKETFTFYSKLKLPSEMSKELKKSRVEAVISELGLEKVEDSIVGTQFKRGISGGEKKRVSIGTELITDPGLLFLDEPTTGLDSYNSLGVLDNLHRLAKGGRTIICTIHQPRSTIYEFFDRLMLLSSGNVVYFGPAKDAISYFAGLKFFIKPFINPADFLLDVINKTEGALEVSDHDVKYLGFTVDSSIQGADVNLSESYLGSELCITNRKTLADLKSRSYNMLTKMRNSEYATNVFVQFACLLKRNLTNILRTPTVTYIQLFQTIFMALLVGSIFFDVKLNQGSIQDRVGALFFILTNSAFSQFSYVNLFLEERNLTTRERSVGTYRTSAYYLAKNVSDACLLCISPLVFSSIGYWMVGLQPHADKFGIFLLTMVVFVITASSLFLVIATVSPNQVVATIIAPILLVLLLLFGGFYVNAENIPVYYKWIYYISPFRYGYEILMKNEFTGLKFTCKPDEEINGRCPIPTGEDVLQRMGMLSADIWTHLAILACTILLLRIAAYVFLRFLYKEKA